MTRYDPFSFGQVDLTGEKAAPPSPDDMLFADSGTSVRNAPPEDSSWGLLDADVDSLLPGAKTVGHGLDFGSEVLGESMASMPMATAAPVRARPAATPRPAPMDRAAVASSPRSTDAPRREVGTRPLATPAVIAESPGKSPACVVRRPSSVGRIGGRPGLSAVVVPLVLFLGGGTGAAWLYAMQQNAMMASIVGALTLVATVFTRILLRG